MVLIGTVHRVKGSDGISVKDEEHVYMLWKMGANGSGDHLGILQ